MTYSSVLTNPALDPSVFARYDRELSRYLMRRVGRRIDVGDLAQEVYMRLVLHRPDQPITKPLAYIYGVASHVVADYKTALAEERQHLTMECDFADGCVEEHAHPTSAGIEETLTVLQQIEHALSELPPTQAAVLFAHKGCGYSYREVAEKLGLSIHTVEKYVTQAKGKFRALSRDAPSNSPGTMSKRIDIRGARP